MHEPFSVPMKRGSRRRDPAAPTVGVAAQALPTNGAGMGDPNDNESNHQTDGRDPLQGGPRARGRTQPPPGGEPPERHRGGAGEDEEGNAAAEQRGG
jgi:hypothetical protein